MPDATTQHEVRVLLGVLSHADVGAPGRRLVRDAAHGSWRHAPARRVMRDSPMSWLSSRTAAAAPATAPVKLLSRLPLPLLPLLFLLMAGAAFVATAWAPMPLASWREAFGRAFAAAEAHTAVHRHVPPPADAPGTPERPSTAIGTAPPPLAAPASDLARAAVDAASAASVRPAASAAILAAAADAAAGATAAAAAAEPVSASAGADASASAGAGAGASATWKPAPVTPATSSPTWPATLVATGAAFPPTSAATGSPVPAGQAPEASVAAEQVVPGSAERAAAGAGMTLALRTAGQVPAHSAGMVAASRQPRVVRRKERGVQPADATMPVSTARPARRAPSLNAAPLPLPVALAEPAVLFNEPASAVDRSRPLRAARVADRLVAIQDARTVVVRGADGRPAAFRLGDQLPSGARVLTVDPGAGTVQTDRGGLSLE